MADESSSELPIYTKNRPPAYVQHATSRQPPISSPLNPSRQSQPDLPALSLPPASDPTTTTSPQPRISPTNGTSPNVMPSPTPSAWSAYSSPSIRDFAHPPDTPEHTLPSPIIEPSHDRPMRGGRRQRRTRGAPPTSTPEMSLGPPSLGSPPAYEDGAQDGRARRYPAVFASEDEYLKALKEWADEKLFMESPKDGRGKSVELKGFYGQMRSEDYVKRENGRMNKGSGGEKGVARAESRKGKAGGEDESSAGAKEEGRRKSLAQWMRKKTGAS